MDLGYDSFLDGELERHAQGGYDDDRIRELAYERAVEVGSDTGTLLEWLADRTIPLAEIRIKSRSTDRDISALSALIAYAPAWLREVACEGVIENNDLSETVVYFGGKPVDVETALVADAPKWLRDSIIDWLATCDEIEDDVRDSIKESARLAQEDRAAAIYDARF